MSGSPPPPLLVRSLRAVERAAAVVAALVSAGIMLGVVMDVSRRQTIGGSIPGMLELVETFMVVVVFLGLAHAEAVGAHVRMGLVTRALPELAGRIVRMAAMAVCMLGSLWFTWATGRRALFAMEIAEVKPGLLRFPVWPARGVIAIGFALLALEYVVRIWEEWHGARVEESLGDAVPTTQLGGGTVAGSDAAPERGR
jgi:TRAP-type C4-dicarboxylate transport system permease small subunit